MLEQKLPFCDHEATGVCVKNGRPEREFPYGIVEALDHCLQMLVFGLIVTQAKVIICLRHFGFVAVSCRGMEF